MLDRPEIALWSARSVRDALAEAYRVLHFTERKPGHKRLKAFWPETLVEFSDETGAWGQGTQKQVRMPKPRFTAEQIHRMEIVVAGTWVEGRYIGPWLNGPIRAYPNLFRSLTASTMARARGYSERQLCEAMKWERRAHGRNRDQGAQMIADRLNVAGVRVW